MNKQSTSKLKSIALRCVSYATVLLLLVSYISSVQLFAWADDANAQNGKLDVSKYEFTLSSNVTTSKKITFYEQDDRYYITMATLIALTDFEYSIAQEGNKGEYAFPLGFEESTNIVALGNVSTIIDGLRSVEINHTDGILREEEQSTEINTFAYQNTYLVEAIPLLRYLGAECSYNDNDGIFYCLMPDDTIWSVLQDAREMQSKTLYHYSYFFPDYEKRIRIEIIYDCLMNLNIPAVDDYYSEAIYDILDSNCYDYDSVKTETEKRVAAMNSFLSSDEMLEIYDVSKDVANMGAEKYIEFYLNQQLQGLNQEWIKAVEDLDVQKSADISYEINIKSCQLYESKGYLNKIGDSVKSMLYVANIADSFAKNYSYSDETANCIKNGLDEKMLQNSGVNTQDWYWLSEAYTISNKVNDNWENIKGSFFDETANLMKDEGIDLLINSIGEGASSFTLLVKSEFLLGRLVFHDTYDMVQSDLLSAFQSDMQAHYIEVCNALYLKIRKEKDNPNKTSEQRETDTEQLLNAYKFYYRLTLSYLSNVSKQYEERTRIDSTIDDVALMYYRLVNCTKVPNRNFENSIDTCFQNGVSDNWLQEIFNINSYTGRYGKDNIYVEISPVGDSEVDISVEFLSVEKNILSSISYHGAAEKFMSFEARDHSSKNAYTVELLEDTVHLTVHRIEYINELNAWNIPDTDITLIRLSEQTTNRDISSWTNEMIANAINQYLDQRVSVATDYYVLSSEMEENEYGRYVYAHHKSGIPSTPQTNYFVTWDKQDEQEDIAYFAVDSTDSFVRFHITDFDPNYKSFVPEHTGSSWQQLYAGELRNYMNTNFCEETMFNLYDVDEDGVPELFLSEGTYTASNTVVYTCYNDKTVNMGKYGQYGVGVSCTLAYNWLISSGGSQGAYHLSYYEKRDDELIKIISFSDNEAMATSDDFEVRYWVNDELVSKEKYYEEMGKYTALENESVETRKYSLNESTINSVLLSSST